MTWTPCLPDRTGCNHRIVKIFGDHSCKLCSAGFVPVETGEGIRLSIVAPPKLKRSRDFADQAAVTMRLAYVKLDQIRAMLPALEENRATKAVARKLTAILDG